MSEIDRELSAALDVDASVEFAARVRTRIADEAVENGWQAPRWAWGAIACAALAAVVVNVLPSTERRSEASSLPHRSLMVVSTFPETVQRISPVIQSAASRPPAWVSDVIVSRSEMLALQRLFAGATVMPPAPEPPSDEPELSIPAISLVPIPVPGSSGERQ